MQPGKSERIMKYKLLYSGLILLVYILGRCIPLYGLNGSLRPLKNVNAEEMLMQTVGGDAYRSSIFALGISPYITASIAVQIVMSPRHSTSKVRVSPGKVSLMTAGLTLIIAVLQAFVRANELKPAGAGDIFFLENLLVMVEMVTGVMVILWLSERNAKYGIGGRTILILVNILDGMLTTLSGYEWRSLAIPLIVSTVVMLIIIVMENAEKRIPVQRISIHNIYADKNYMAIKLNSAGVMPVMFSTALFMLPEAVLFLLSLLFPDWPDIIWWQKNMALTCPLGIAVYVACLYVLTIGFSMLLLSPKDITEQFLRSGDSIVELHAGRDTRRYLRGVMCRISLFSATVMGLCVTTPLIMQMKGNIDSGLAMFPSSVMMMTGLWCNLYREGVVIRNYDTYRPLL